MARKTEMQRKRFLVDKKVQGALGFRIATHWLVFFSISIVLTCFLKMPANYAELDPMNSFVDALGNQVASIFVLVALLPWFLYDSLKLSNRFAGPMVRLNKSIVQLGNGEELAPISFRGNDFWQEAASNFNVLRSRVLDDKAKLAKLQADGTSPEEDATPIPAIDPIDTVRSSAGHVIS